VNPNLSKRSSLPGMRTGFVAGDAGLIRAFLPYRTHPSSAMGLPVQAASVATWGGETHLAENRRPMENTACTARSLSNAWMPGPAPKRASTSCCARIRLATRAAPLRGLI
jgi:aspartate/methionine/tyrosine aminotransferase